MIYAIFRSLLDHHQANDMKWKKQKSTTYDLNCEYQNDRGKKTEQNKAIKV